MGGGAEPVMVVNPTISEPLGESQPSTRIGALPRPQPLPKLAVAMPVIGDDGRIARTSAPAARNATMKNTTRERNRMGILLTGR
jgi:hypothetical protein